MRVDSDALRHYADVLDRLGGTSAAARTYARRWGDLPIEQAGLLNTAHLKHWELLETLASVLDHLGHILATSSMELNQAADFYQHSDARAAERADLTYPDPGRPADVVW